MDKFIAKRVSVSKNFTINGVSILLKFSKQEERDISFLPDKKKPKKELFKYV